MKCQPVQKARRIATKAWIVLLAGLLVANSGGAACNSNPTSGGGGGGGPTGVGGGSGTVGTPTPSPEAQRIHAALTPALITDTKLANYLRDVGNRIIANAPPLDRSGRAPAVYFHLVRADGVVNATTTGTGYVYVTAELFRRCADEEELAACLAHAYAHAYLRHRPAGVVGDGTNNERSAEQIVLDFVAKPFGPAEEREADRTAYELFARAGWDPDRFGAVYRELASSRDLQGAVDLDALRRRADTQVQLSAASRDWRTRSVADTETFRSFQQQVASLAGGRAGVDDQAQLVAQSLPSCIFSTDQPQQRDAQAKLKAQMQTKTPEGGPDPGNREKGRRRPL